MRKRQTAPPAPGLKQSRRRLRKSQARRDGLQDDQCTRPPRRRRKKAQTDGRTAGRSDEEQAATGEDVPSLTIRENSAQIGTTIVGRRLVAIPVAALPTHVAVVGAAGSGKTWLAKVLAEEAIRLGIPVLAIDPQGDLVQFLRPAAEFPDLTPEEKALRRGFLDRVEPRVWTPGSSHGRRLCLDPIRLAKPSDLAHITDPIRREEEWEGMLAVVAAQLVGTAKVGGETDSQQTFLLQVFGPWPLIREGGRWTSAPSPP